MSLAALFLSSCMVFDIDQKIALSKAYEYGEPHDYGYTLAAIAWKESSAGKYRLNIESKDIGLFQINAKTAYNTLRVTNYYKRIELVQELLTNDYLGAYIAVETLEHFRAGRRLSAQVYQEMLMSYNTGYTWKTSEERKRKALAYSEDVRHKVRELQRCKETWKITL